MKFTFLLFCFFCSCSNKIASYSYEITNKSLGDYILAPNKFISHKKYLFEFLKTYDFTTEIDKNKTKKNTKVSNKSIYILEKDSDIIYEIDSFKIDCKILSVLNLSNKKYGINISKPDSMTVQVYNKIKFYHLKDTIIENHNLKYIDTTFQFNNSFTLLNKLYYIKKDGLNTVFNIQKNSIDEKALPNTLYGITSENNNGIIASYMISNLVPLNNSEIEICESIISKIKVYKLKKG